MKYFSLFSGIGGFELGIQQAYENLRDNRKSKTRASNLSPKRNISSGPIGMGNWRNEQPECIGFSEIDKYATVIYQKHFPEHKNYGDITTINEKELPDFDLVCGGFPCQAFSIAGKRAGFNDTRGTLFFEIARIIKQKLPRLLLLENVKGLLSHDGGKTFRIIISTLDELGYDIQWQVLNSKNFGVPQNRERVFIVGNLRGTPRPEVFPIRENDQVSNREVEAKSRQPQTEVTHTLRGTNVKADQSFIVHNVYGGFGEKNVREFHDHAPTIRTPKGGGHIPMVVTAQPKYSNWKRRVDYKESSIVPTIRSTMSKRGDNDPLVMQEKVAGGGFIKVLEATKQGYAIAKPGDSINLAVPNSKTRRGRVGKGVAQTLDTGMQQCTLDSEMRIRRLTPIECERLQGFPDDWTKQGVDFNYGTKGEITGGAWIDISDTQRYKTIGNAVSTPVIKAIAERLLSPTAKN